jgi:hypothetical protein
VGLYTQLVTTRASFLQRRKSDAAKATLASFSWRRPNDARLMYTYHGFRHLRLVPRVLRYSTGFYGTAVTLTILVTQKFIIPSSPTACLLTPLTPCAGRHAFRKLRAAPSSVIINCLEHGYMKLTTKVSLLKTYVLSLKQAIVL